MFLKVVSNLSFLMAPRVMEVTAEALTREEVCWLYWVMTLDSAAEVAAMIGSTAEAKRHPLCRPGRYTAPVWWAALPCWRPQCSHSLIYESPPSRPFFHPPPRYLSYRSLRYNANFDDTLQYNVLWIDGAMRINLALPLLSCLQFRFWTALCLLFPTDHRLIAPPLLCWDCEHAQLWSLLCDKDQEFRMQVHHMDWIWWPCNFCVLQRTLLVSLRLLCCYLFREGIAIYIRKALSVHRYVLILSPDKYCSFIFHIIDETSFNWATMRLM